MGRHRAILALATAVGASALWVLNLGGVQAAPHDRVYLQPIPAGALDALETRFAREGFAWPPTQPEVPRLALSALPAGLEAARTERRKAAFLRALLPLVLAENRRLRADRERLVAAVADPAGGAEVLSSLAARYGVEGDPQVRSRLLRRVDEIPPALGLAQAALESGWGTSRFAREGNSLFGQWTWDPDAGLTPERRAPGKTHGVRRFADLRASVRAYLHNLNTGTAYRELRRLRSAMRADGRPLDADALAAGLVRYSERRQAYVEEVRAVMRANGLVERLAGLRLRAR